MTTLERQRPLPTTDQPPPPEPRSRYGSAVLGAILVLGGGLWLLDSIGVLELRVSVMLPIALTVVGVALVIGARNGQHPALVVVGLFLALAVVITGIAPRSALDGAAGAHTFVVTSATDLSPRYDLGVGELTINLSAITLDRAATVAAEVGAGHLVLELPADVPVRVESTVGIGDLRLPDDSVSGVGLDKSYQSDDFAGSPVGITVVANVGIGQLEVRR